MAIVAVPGSADANSYVTEAEADSYFANRIAAESPWVAGAAGNANALLTAARLLDARYSVPRETFEEVGGILYRRVGRAWKGTLSSTTQALAWPRTSATDHRGAAIPGDAIPAALKSAQCELAALLSVGDRLAEPSTLGVRELKVGEIAFKFDGSSPPLVPEIIESTFLFSLLTSETVTPAASPSVRAKTGKR